MSRPAENAYITRVLEKYALPTGHLRQVSLVRDDLHPHIQRWAGNNLLAIKRSGSFAKGTAVRGGTDLDLFISLKASGSGTLAQMYESLYRSLQQEQLAPSRQDVSIGLEVRGLKVDLVPARRQVGQSGDHSLYRQRTKTWTQTNIERHVRIVKGSGLQREIRALKIWRRLHGLEFPSILIELTAVEAMRGRKRSRITDHLSQIWNWMSAEIVQVRIIDPANSANIISDVLKGSQKSAIAARASWSLERKTWNEVLW